MRQVVLAAAGLDTRAFRLDWPSRTRLYEIDLPGVLNTKEDVIGKTGANPNCERLTVGVDLQEATWPDALVARGYRLLSDLVVRDAASLKATTSRGQGRP